MSKVAMSPRGPIVAERKVRILIVDDHPIFRQGIRQLLEQERDFSVVAEAADGEEAIKLVTELSPDIVLMDMGMPKLNGLEATRQIKKEYPNIMVLALTVHVEDEYIFSILGAGAEGYLLKTTQNSELVQAIRSVLSGNFVFAPCVVRRLLKHAATYPVKPIRVSYGQSITPREIEVLKLSACGTSNKNIALQLGISTRTVKGHLTSIFSKLGVESRSQAIAYALKNNWLSVEDLA